MKDRGRTVAQRDDEPIDHDKLLLSSWLDRVLPERDYLLGNVMCTTSRWFLFGETGIGKTLFGMEVGAAIASGEGLLGWCGYRDRYARVMYLDGELPVETFQERMKLIAKRHGRDILFYGYNREDLGDGRMPPLNTDPGQAWLRREIGRVKPDLIIFDSIMCLLIGSMSEEESWAPMKGFVRELTARRIAQMWMNHANDVGKSFGTKTREWEMDTVLSLASIPGEDGAPSPMQMKLEFRKMCLRTAENMNQFKSLIIDLETFKGTEATDNGRELTDIQIFCSEIMEAYRRMAIGQGWNGINTVKVPMDWLREEVKKRGFLETNDNGGLSSTGRSTFHRAKAQLIRKHKLVENDGLIWSP
jgi:AAA domain